MKSNNKYRISFLGLEKVLELNSGNSHKTLYINCIAWIANLRIKDAFYSVSIAQLKERLGVGFAPPGMIPY